jgi:hypothetical protein
MEGVSSCEPQGSWDVRWASQNSALDGQSPFNFVTKHAQKSSRQICDSGLGSAASLQRHQQYEMLHSFTYPDQLSDRAWPA